MSEVRKKMQGEVSVFVCGGPGGQKGCETGERAKNKFTKASPTSKSVKISIKPSAPITGKTEWTRNRGGGVRGRAEPQNEPASPHSLSNFLLHSPLHTVNYWPGIPLPPFHT